VPFAVELDIDGVAASKIGTLAERLERIPDLDSVRKSGDVHHLSLAVYEDLPADRFVAHLIEFSAGVQPIVLQLANIGIFSGARSVLFLGPVVTQELLAFHRRFHDAFSEFVESCWEYYRPGHWVPHVTLAMNIEAAALERAVAETREHWKPAKIKLGAVKLIHFPPFRTIYRSTLQSDL
jgi:2'-5' RNA ligase